MLKNTPKGGEKMTAMQKRINRMTGVSSRGARRAISNRIQSAMRAQ